MGNIITEFMADSKYPEDLKWEIANDIVVGHEDIIFKVIDIRLNEIFSTAKFKKESIGDSKRYSFNLNFGSIEVRLIHWINHWLIYSDKLGLSGQVSEEDCPQSEAEAKAIRLIRQRIKTQIAEFLALEGGK